MMNFNFVSNFLSVWHLFIWKWLEADRVLDGNKVGGEFSFFLLIKSDLWIKYQKHDKRGSNTRQAECRTGFSTLHLMFFDTFEDFEQNFLVWTEFESLSLQSFNKPPSAPGYVVWSCFSRLLCCSPQRKLLLFKSASLSTSLKFNCWHGVRVRARLSVSSQVILNTIFWNDILPWSLTSLQIRLLTLGCCFVCLTTL